LIALALRSLLACLVMLGPSSCQVSAQSGKKVEPPPENPTEEINRRDEVLRIRTEEVLLPISIRDAAGLPVSGLGRERFIVFDNGVRQEIASFNRQRVPANIVLLLDASSSVFSQMRFIREAATRFMEGLLPEDKVCVMQFADRVELLAEWTGATNLKQLEKAVTWRYHPGLRTTFFDGLYLAAEEQLSKVEGRRIVILLTDGLDTAERKKASFADALNAVRRSEASVYVVSLTASLRAQLEERTGKSKLARLLSGYDKREVAHYLSMLDESEALLNVLAVQTGGRIFLPVKDEELAPAYRAIADELRMQYIITYQPKPRVITGEYRRVRVLITGGEYEVGTRAGYMGRR
jgi:VWFA-related protein